MIRFLLLPYYHAAFLIPEVADIPKTHRILDPVLGGGALLDLWVLVPFTIVYLINTIS